MIKQSDYQQSKAIGPAVQLVDSLASALGYKREGNAYVKSVRAYHKKVATPKVVTHKKKRKYGPRHEQFSLATYASISALPLHQPFDITDEVHRCGLSFKEATGRIASWASFNRTSGSIQGHYRVYRESWRIKVVRFQ